MLVHLDVTGIGVHSIRRVTGSKSWWIHDSWKFIREVPREPAIMRKNCERKAGHDARNGSPHVFCEHTDTDCSFLRNFVVFEEEYSRFTVECEGNTTRDHAIVRACRTHEIRILYVNGASAMGDDERANRTQQARSVKIIRMGGVSPTDRFPSVLEMMGNYQLEVCPRQIDHDFED
jgi:hypothetical protein